MMQWSDRNSLWAEPVLGTMVEHDALVEINSVGVVAGWNRRAEEWFGTELDSATGERTLSSFLEPLDRLDLEGAIAAVQASAVSSAAGRRVQIGLVQASGSKVQADVLVIPGPGEIAGSTLLILRGPVEPDFGFDMSYRTPLVGIENNHAGGLVSLDLFMDLLVNGVEHARSNGGSVAVLRVELEEPEASGQENEQRNSPGYSTEVCETLCRVAGADGVVAASPLGGFAMLLAPLGAPFFAANLADRLSNEFRDRPQPEGGMTYSAVSVGIGFLEDEGSASSADILNHAEVALIRAKDLRGVGGGCEVFDNRLRAEIAERRRFRNELYEAIDAGDFRVFYQPATDLGDGRITMVEALVRWDHPTRGLIAAGEFVDLAEECGLILPLGAWVLNEACRQLREWRDEFGESAPVGAVNFSSHQLHHPTAVQLVAGVIEANGLDPDLLCIEVTEAALMREPRDSFERLQELAALGVSLSIDHFGVEPALLAYLDEFPIDLVKVDRSLVRDLGTSEAAHEAASSMVDRAHALGISVAAEGVETAEQFAAASLLGCDHVQGFYVARPQSALDVSRSVTRELAGSPNAEPPQ